MKSFKKVFAQIFQRVRAPVCQRILRLRPDPLVGIQLGRIGRKRFDMKPFESAAQIADRFPLMRGDIIPDDDHILPKMFEEMTQKCTDFIAPDILFMEGEEQSKPLERGAERERRDHGNALANKVMSDSRRVSFRAPGLAHRRSQEESRFVDEDEMGAQPRGVFFIRGH